MSDLVTFLRARLDEDEHWAHMAEAGWPPENALAASEDPEHYAFMATDITPSKAAFIRRHDPARVLRWVEAGRAILAAHEAVLGECHTMELKADRRPRKYGEYDGLHKAIVELAAVYRDHPDYLPEWKP